MHAQKQWVLNCTFACYWDGSLIFQTFNMFLSPGNVDIVYIKKYDT